MAGPTIKEYVIKITAEAKNAQAEIDKLAESFSKVGISGKFNLDLEKQTESINGSIGKITEQLVALKEQFKDGIDTRNLSDDIKNLSKELTEAVNSMKTSFDGFAKTYEGLSLTPNGDLGAKMDDFISSMGAFIEKYNDLFGKLGQTKVPVDIVPNMEVVADSVRTQGQSIDEAKKQLDEDKKKLLEAQEAQEEIDKIVKSFNKNRANIINASQSGVKKTRTGERLMTTKELENAEYIVREAIKISNKYKSKKIDGINVQELLFNKIDTTPKGLERSLEGIVDNIGRAVASTRERVIDNVKNSGEVTDVQFKISLHPDAISEETINSLVTQIRTQVIDKIQKRINDNYIKIPIGLTSESGLEEKTQDMIEAATDDKHLSGIRKSLYVDVKANVKGLAEQIDTEIKNLNKNITQTIDVKIRPVIPDSYALSDAIAETSERLGNTASEDGYIDGMVPIDISKLNIQSNTFDEKSFGELTTIRDLVSRILSILSGRNPNTPPPPAPIPVQPNNILPPGGSNGAKNTNTPPIAPPPSTPIVTQPNKIINTDTIRTQEVGTQNINNVVTPKQDTPKMQTKAQDDKTSSLEKLLSTPRRPYDFDRFQWAIMRGRNINAARENTTNQNWITSASRDAERLYKEGIHAFLNDLKNPNQTLADMQSKNYYATSYSSQDQKMAYFGKPGQTLESFQAELTDVFKNTNKEIVDAVTEIKHGFEIDRTSLDLVDSGIDGKKVTKWMKRIIDDDSYQEEQDLKGKRFSNKKKEMNEANPNWATAYRNNILQGLTQQLADAKEAYDANSKDIRALNEQKWVYEDRLEGNKNGLKMRQQYLDDLRAGKYSNIDGLDEQQAIISAQIELDRFKKSSNEDREKYTPAIDSIKEDIVVLTNLEEELGKRILEARNNITSIKSSNDDELLQMQIKEQHKQRRTALAEYTGEITDEFDKDLNNIQNREIKKKANELATGAITAKFGASVLRTQKNGNVSQIDVKNEHAQARIRDLERNGLVVDEKTGNIISFKTPEISRNWSYEDLTMRLNEVSEIAQEKLQEQIGITDQLSHGEEELNQYIEAYEKHLSGTATQEDNDIIASLKEQVGERAAYFTMGDQIEDIIDESEQLFSKIKSGKATKAEKSRYQEISQMLSSYWEMNEQQVYEMAQQQKQMIEDSRKQEKYIIGHYKGILSDMADKDSSRRISKATYQKLKTRYKELGKTTEKYQRRVRVTDTGVDTSQLTPYESDQYWKAYRARGHIRRKILGYEFANGIRDFNGRTANEVQGELSVGKMVVTNLGLSKETGKSYAQLPAIKSISELYRDESGKIQYDRFGAPMLSNTTNMTSSQLESNAELLTTVVREINAKLDTLPTDEDQIRQIATERVDTNVKEMQDSLKLVNEQISERTKFNQDHEEEIKSGKVSPKAVKYLEAEKAVLEESIKTLSTNSKGTKRVEQVRKDREELAKLKEEENTLIKQYQEETGISNDVVQKIEALAEAKRYRRQIEKEYKDLGDVAGTDEEHIGLKMNRAPHVKAINNIISSIFGQNALTSFDYKAVTGYDYKTAEEIVQHLEDLGSRIKMYDDIVAAAEEELKKVLPKGKANKLLKDATLMDKDEFGAKQSKAESGRIMDKLVENRNKQEELAGAIRKNEYDMQRDGEVEQSLREARIQTVADQIKNERRELTSIAETAKKDSASYRQMAALQRERETEKVRIDELKAKVDPLVGMPVEKRTEEIEAESQRVKAEIDEELRKENEKLLEQRNAIIETYNQSGRDLQQKQQALAMANSSLDKVKAEGTTSIPSAEQVYMENQEYALLYNQIKDLEGARRQEKSVENRKQINQQLMGLNQQKVQLQNSIQSQQVGIIDELIVGLQDAVEKNLPADQIQQIGNNLLNEYNKYLAFGITSGKNNVDFSSEYEPINGQSPIDYARKIIGGVSEQEIADKEKVVQAAQQELELAQQRYNIAQQNYASITSGALGETGTITQLEQELTHIMMNMSNISGKRQIAQGKLNTVSKEDPNYENLKKEASDASAEYDKLYDKMLSVQGELKRQRGEYSNKIINSDMADYDSTRARLITLQSKKISIEEEKTRELEALSKGADEYQSFLYDKYRLPKPQDVRNKKKLKNASYYNPGSEGKRKQAVQQAAFTRQANLDRYLYGAGGVEIDKMEVIKASRKAKRQAQQQARQQQKSDNIFDSFYFADMTNDQAVVSKKIQRLATQRNKRYGLSPAGEAELKYLHEEARKLGLEIQDNGYVKPLISKEEFQNNRAAHNVPQLSQQELIQKGILSAREQYSAWAKHNEELKDELAQTDEMAQKYYGASQDIVPNDESWEALKGYQNPEDELDDIGETVKTQQENLRAATINLIKTLNPGEYKQELNDLYKSLLPSLGTAMQPQDIFNAVKQRLVELQSLKKQPDKIQQQAQGTQSRNPEAEQLLKRFRDAVSAKNIDSKGHKEETAKEYKRLSQQVLQKKILPEYAASTLKNFVDNLVNGTESKPQKANATTKTGVQKLEKDQKSAGQAVEKTTEKLKEQQKVAQEAPTGNALTYNGKQYPYLADDKRKEISGRIKSSKDLAPLMGIKKDAKRNDIKSVNAVKEALNAYVLTGENEIIEELKKSISNGKNKNLGRGLKLGVKAFINSELGLPTIDIKDKATALQSMKDVFAQYGKDGLVSALKDLSQKQMIKIAEDNGYPKNNKLKNQSKDAIANLIAGKFEQSFGSQTSPIVNPQAEQLKETEEQANRTAEAIQKGNEASGQADTTGLEQVKEKADEVTESATRAAEAISTVKEEAEAAPANQTPALPIYGANGRVLGKAKRNNTPYNQEEFAANPGLAEKVLEANGAIYNTDYWIQSRANAQAYLDTLKEVEQAQDQVAGDQSPILSDAEKMFYRNFNSKHGMFSNDPGGSFMTDSLQTIKEAYSYKDSLMSAQLKKNAKLLKVDVGGASYDEGISHIGNNDKLQALVTEYESIMSRLEKTGSSPYLYMGIDALDEKFDFSDDEKRVMELHQAIQIVNSDLQQMGAYQYKGLFELPDTKQFAQKAFNNGFDAVLFENIADQLGETITELDNYDQILSNVLTVKDESVLTNIRDITNSAREMDIVLKGSLSEEEKLERTSNAIGSKRNNISNETPALTDQSIPTEPTAQVASETTEAAAQAETLAQNLDHASVEATEVATKMQETANAAKAAAQAVAQVPDTQVPVNKPKDVVKPDLQQKPTTTPLLLQDTKSQEAQNETAAFAQMGSDVNTLNGYIATKNELLSAELGIVQQELTVITELVAKMQALKDAAGGVKINLDFSKADGLNEEFIQKFNGLAQEIQTIDVQKFDSVGKVLEGFNIGKNVGKNFQTLGEGIRAFVDTASQGLTGNNNFSDLMNLIDRIVDSGEYISKMSDVLKNSAKASQGAFGFKYSQDPHIEEQMKEYVELMNYLSKPANLTRNQYLERQADKTGLGVATKDAAWYSDYQEKLKQAEALYAILSEVGVLENKAQKTLFDKMNSYKKTVSSVENSMGTEYITLGRAAQERVASIGNSIDTKALGKGLAELKHRIDELTVSAGDGKLTVEEYKTALNDAFTRFGKWQKLNNTAFGNLASTKLMDTPQGYTQENARQFAEEYIKNKYKNVISDISETTKVVDGSQVSVFTAKVQDAQGVVQNLRIAWSDVSNEIRIASSEVSRGETGIDNMLKAVTGKLKGLYAYWGAQLFNPYRLVGYAKQLMSVVKTYDSALMEMRKVSSESTDTLREFQDASFGVADQVGTTAATIQSSAASWMRLGKSLSESAEAAKASAWLVNVSEFTSIDDATSSLISLRQAFQDLSYEDFIDKLNGVGDSFSSSTTDLAKGMQNVAAVLKTNGNDLDQSLALLTAANDITQDISKASMGVRTIALRISGTEDAKAELEELGEDTSDFIVQTQSKVDAKVRKYTATNDNPNGISVLDENGRLRNTYDILLDISKVYDQIVEKDNQFGTNTSNALLELLAGKTRSNVLASIFQNPQLLEDAYETSKNSKGVGQKELDAYLDSIEARLSKAKNQLESILTSLVDSDSVKLILDLFNQILSVINKVTDAFGGLNTTVSLFVSTFMRMKGFSLFSSKNGAGFLSQMLGIGSKAQVAKQLNPLQQQLQNIFSNIKYNDADDFMEVMGKNGFTLEKMTSNAAFTPLLESIDHTTDASFTMGQAMQVVNTQLNATSTFAANAGGMLSKLATGAYGVVKSFASIGLTTLAFAAVSKAIGFVIEKVHEWITADERAIEAGKKAREEANELAKTYADTQKKTEELGKKYNELRGGVTYTEGKGYTNKNLSNDQFEEFLQVNKDLIALYPQLRAGTDAQGNSYVNLGDNASKATEQLKEYLDVQNRITNRKIGETLDTQVDGVIATAKQLDNALDELNLDDATQDLVNSGAINLIQEDKEKTKENGLPTYTFSLSDVGGVNKDAVDAIRKAFQDQNIDNKEIFSQFYNGVDTVQTIEFEFMVDEKSKQDVESALEEIGYSIDTKVGDATEPITYDVYENKRKKADEYESLRPAVIGMISGTRTYNNLSEEVQSGINKIYSQIDLGEAVETWQELSKNSNYTKKFSEYLKDQYLYVIDSAINNAGKDVDPKEQAEKLSKLFTFDDTDLTAEEATKQIDNIISSIFSDEEDQKTIRIGLGFDIVTDAETGETQNKYEQQAQDVYDIIGDQINTSVEEIQSKLKISDLTDIISLDEAGNFKFSGDSFESLFSWLENVRKQQAEMVKDGTLSDIFNDAEYKEHAEGYESTLSTLSSSLETLKTNGELAADEMAKLQEAFPDMTDFSKDTLSSNGIKALSKWIEELRKDYDLLSDEGKKQVDTYVNNLMSSFGNVIATENEARTAIYGALFDSHATDVQKQAQAEQIEETIKALQDKYGEELDWNIVWQLAVNDQLSGNLEDIYANYNERVLNWDLNVNIPEEVLQLEKNIEGRNSRINAIEAEIGYYDATGNFLPDLNENWYKEMLRLSGQNIADKTSEYTMAQEKYANSLLNPLLDQSSKDQSSNVLYKAMADARTAMVQAMTEQADIQKQYYEFQARMYTDEINEAETNATRTQARIDQAKYGGARAQESDYNELRDSYRTQAEMQEMLANFWDTVANDGKANPVMRAIASQNAATARANVISANESADEAERGWLTDELLEKQNTYNDLQTEASEIEQKITDDETKHRKVSNKRYDELIKNGDKQIASLKDQRSTLLGLQEKTVIGTEKWREYQSQINDVNSSISSMENSQIGWYDSMTTAVSSNAQTLASALESAFSEINSETGLTRDTMNTLMEQFSDLENYDVSKIFYSTADGMKFNTDATRELIDAEYDLQISNLRDAIAEETEIIEKNRDSKDANAYATMQQAQSNIDAYNAELAALQALYDQQQESLSRYSAWETAKSTANAGDKYTNLQGSWKDIQEMRKNGLTGTDDFQSYIAFFDEWGMGTVEAYERNKKMISRYITEDGLGMKNFYDDLVSKGFGTKEGNIYSIGIEDTEAAAHAMGMSEEALRMLLDRGEDYGFRNTWVETVLDGELKLQDTTEQLIEEQERLQNMKVNGATEEQIKNQQDLVNQLKDNMKNYIENTADVAAEDNTKSYNKTIEQLKAINELRGETFDTDVQMTDRQLETYNKQLDDAMQQALGGYSKDELISFKAEFEAEMDDDSKRIVDQMIELAGQREEIKAYINTEVDLHDADGNGITPEEFLSMTSEEQAQVIKETYGVEVDDTNYNLWIEELQNQTPTAKIKAVVDTGTATYDDLLNMNAEQLTQTIGIQVDDSNIEEVKSQIEALSAVKVTLDESSITSLTTALGQAIAVAISTDEASEQVDGFVNETEDKTATVNVNADTSKANRDIQRFVSEVMALHPSLSVVCDASSLITSVQEILARQQFKVNVSANAPAAPSPVVKKSKSKGGSSSVTGRNNGYAFANGKPGDLVGELGQEMVVDPHSGRYYTVGDNGPEFTDIPDDAIVFNADQTKDLLKHGHTSTRGRALVTGNAFDSTNSTNEFVYNDPKNTFGKGTGNSKDTRDNTKATKDNTKASKEQKTALDKFNEWLGKFVDWIDNRIDTLTKRIERFEKRAEQRISYTSKNKEIQRAMNTLSTIDQFQNGELKTKSVTGTNGVTAQIATGTKNAKKGTLLGDTMRGAVRYQKQADKVMRKAVKSGLLSQKKANEITKLIQTGEIDIRKYNEKVRAVISAYEDWFGKSQDLIDSTYDLKQQFKDLEQTKLDNITERFETLVGLIEATKAASEATVDLYTTQGRAVNTGDRKQMLYQRDRQGRITEELAKEEKAYQDELKRARTIFGADSNEYREARTQLFEIRKSLTESRNAELELTHAIEELRFTVRGFVIERLESFVEKLSGIASLAEKRGTNNALGYRVTEDPYAEQLRYNNDLILKYAEDLEDRKKEIARRVADPEEGLQINSSEYQELYNKIVADEQALLKLYSTNEDLKMSIRNLRWEEYKKFQETLENISGDLSHIQSFIRDGEILDNDGQFTARGFAQIALIGENMDTAEKKIANARGAIEKLNEELANGTINEETFGEEFEQQMKTIQDAASEAYDDMQKLADLYIKQITEENSILQDLIKSRQDALSKKKAYYDYDKQIREKNKDVNSLRAQVQALQNVSTDAAKARRAQLQAQLAEAEQDLNDTRYDHQIEMQQQGYEQLSEDMQKALDDSVKLINGDQKTLQETAARMLDYLKENDVDEKAVIDSIIESAGTRIHEETKNALNNTLVQDEDGNLGLLSNLNVSVKEGADGIITAVMDVAKAIDMHEVADAIKQINPSVETNKNSDNEDVGEQLKEIEKAYLDVDSTGGTTGETAKGTENVVRDDDQIMKEAKKEAQRKQEIKDNKNKLSSDISSTDKQIADAEKHLKDLQDKHAKYNEYINNWKKKLKEAEKIKDVTKREKAIKEAQDHITSLRAKRDAYVASEKDTKNLIAMLKNNRASMQAELDEITSAEQAEYADLIEQDKDVADKNPKTNSKAGKATTSVVSTQAVSTANLSSVKQASTLSKLTPDEVKHGQNLKKKIDAAVKNGDKHAKSLTQQEKGNHAPLWEYLVKEYGRTGNNKVYTALADALKVNVSKNMNANDKNAILKKLKAVRAKYGFASGTKRVGKNIDAWTNEDWEKLGAEMIVRKSDGAILTPLKANDSVIPANLADNLFKWGAISPDKFLSNPFMGKMGDVPSGANVTNQVEQKVEMHFDSLFTIQGDVNADVMDRLEEFGKALTSDRNFQQNVVKFVTKDFVRESKKQGGFR